MSFKDFYNFSKKPGIYYFKNTLNNKYYIGQAQEIRLRLLKHKKNFENEYYIDSHLYRAWKKYTIDVFEVGVLEIVDLPEGEERNNKLDELEIKYIEEYNSYGDSGYNQTIGGDGGTKGYRFTDQQKERTRINTLCQKLDGRHKVYFYDVITKQQGESLMFQIICDVLNINTRIRKSVILHYNRYIFAHTIKELERKKREYKLGNYNFSYKIKCVNIKNLQEAIDERTKEIRKEIDDFFKKYGHAKYNRKDNKTKKEALRKLQKEDLMNGISKEEYKNKYDIKTNETFFEHVRKLCPDWEPKDNKTIECSSNNCMTEEMKTDILDGIIPIRFIQKYHSSEASYYRYKHKLEKELNIKIKVSSYKEPGKAISKEQEEDILNDIGCIDYMRKYNLSEATFYEHRKIIAKKYPNHNFKKNTERRETVDIELFRKDILNGISKREFCLKYNLSESCYRKYKQILLNNKQKTSHITEEQKTDILNGINVSDYMKKYNVSMSTFYNHRSLILN